MKNRIDMSHRSRLLLAAGLLGLLGAGLAAPALAGSFTVTPVRIYIAPRDRAVAVTVTNEGDQDLVMQADLYQWRQNADGQDELTLTEELFLAPPIIKLAPKARQVVRLALLRPPAPDRQLTYRMIVREVPEARPPQPDMQVQVALAFSLPVFVTPARAKAKLNCWLQRVAPDTARAVCENTGNAHSHPTVFVLKSEAGDTLAREDSGGYILPGIKRSFEMKRKEGDIPAGNAKLTVSFVDQTTQVFDARIGD